MLLYALCAAFFIWRLVRRLCYIAVRTSVHMFDSSVV